jgi:hypothetical protein
MTDQTVRDKLRSWLSLPVLLAVAVVTRLDGICFDCSDALLKIAFDPNI